MAKRVNLKKVNIDNGELNPVTLGYLNSRKKGPFLVIFFVGLLVALVYYMPQISDYITMYLNPSAYNEKKAEDEDIDINEEGKIKELTANTNITVNSILFSDFVLNNNTLSFNISDTTNLDDYHIVTYNINKQILETLPITSDGKVTISKSNISYIAIEIVKEVEPLTEPKDDTLYCEKDNIIYNYTFDNSELVLVSFEVRMMKNTDNESIYLENYNKYLDESSKQAVVGISKSFSNVTNGFAYTVNYDLAKAQMININDSNVFSYKTSKTIVTDTMNKAGYSCH